MTTVAMVSAPSKAVHADRNAALDRARTFITLLVLIHHSVIAYTHYGHIDKQSFLGFDAVVLFNDSFFMAAMFLLSGLFVWPSLQRKGAIWFLRDRWWRLGFPFMVSALLIAPVAYYAIALRLTGESFPDFWWKTVTTGPWEIGPAWFVGVLFAFDLLMALVFAIAPRCLDALGRFSQAGKARPELFVAALLIGSIVVYVPAVLYFGASRWFAAGPLAVQASRVALYALYFVVGMGVGVVAFDNGVLAADGNLARRWRVWLAGAVAFYVCIIGLIYVRRGGILPDPDQPALWWRALYALAFAGYSAMQTINVLALWLRFGKSGRSMLDPMRDSAYGIYLLHYVPVLWMQYALFGLDIIGNSRADAILKAAIVLVFTLAVSWAATVALRQTPGATRVL